MGSSALTRLIINRNRRIFVARHIIRWTKHIITTVMCMQHNRYFLYDFKKITTDGRPRPIYDVNIR